METDKAVRGDGISGQRALSRRPLMPTQLERPSDRCCQIGAFTLASGEVLADVEIAFQLLGPEDAPVIAVLGGISAHRHAGAAEAGMKAWWPGQVGPGRALDTEHYRVLCWDYLGGNGGTTGPCRPGYLGQVFTDVTASDQAHLLARLLDHLGIETLHGFVGASYGGMVAMRFAALHPARVGQLFVVSAAHRHAPTAVALRTLQRKLVEQSLPRDGGFEGLALARALAMVTYRTPQEFSQRFSRTELDVPADPDDTPAWQYLSARGEAYRREMNPYAFLCLSRSIDLHAFDPLQLPVPVQLLGVRQDQLVAPELLIELAEQAGSGAQLQWIESVYGHDAFLTEPALVQAFLSTLTAGRHGDDGFIDD